jgi:hypothetical protein
VCCECSFYCQHKPVPHAVLKLVMEVRMQMLVKMWDVVRQPLRCAEMIEGARISEYQSRPTSPTYLS